LTECWVDERHHGLDKFDRVSALLTEAIGMMVVQKPRGKDVKREDFHAGMGKLIGAGERRQQNITKRADKAADQLGYSGGGNSLTRSKAKDQRSGLDRKRYETLLDGLTQALTGLAGAHGLVEAAKEPDRSPKAPDSTVVLPQPTRDSPLDPDLPTPHSSSVKPKTEDQPTKNLQAALPPATFVPRLQEHRSTSPWVIWTYSLVAILASTGIIILVHLAGTNSPDPTRHKSTTTAAATALPFRVAAAPFAPEDRPAYLYDHFDPNDTVCVAPNHSSPNCGPLKGHVLDSFINNMTYGDERYFAKARINGQVPNASTDPLTNVRLGNIVSFDIYVDNDTPFNQGDPIWSNLQGTRVRMSLHPRTGIDQLSPKEWVFQPKAFISATNAQAVEDGVNLEGPQPFELEYIVGSARLFREQNQYPLSSAITSGKGAPIGLLTMNGELPPGNQFGAAVLVELSARVVAAVAFPKVRVIDRVRIGSRQPWTAAVYAKPGETVAWMLDTTNVSKSSVRNVTTSDILPPNLELIPNSVQFTNARGTEQLQDKPLFGGGYNAGSYNPNDNTLVTFETKVLDNFDGCKVIDRGQVFARWGQKPMEVTNDADVVITKPGCAH
jgi:uncharacterized repeat protein (TIGR01451 family)